MACASAIRLRTRSAYWLTIAPAPSLRIGTFKPGRVLARFDRFPLHALFSGTHSSGVSPAEPQEHRTEEHHHQTPPQIHIDVQRTFVNRLVAEQAKTCEQSADNHEQQANRQSNVQTHGDLTRKRCLGPRTTPAQWR